MKRALMSPSNPDGWKLEDLLATMQAEIAVKSEKIMQDKAPVAQRVLANNQFIMNLLREAEVAQRDSIAALDAFAPDQGPLGKPRIGKGSE